MRLQILTFLCSLFVFVLATVNLEEKANIKALLIAFAHKFDEKKYDQFGKILTDDVTYDVGDGEPPLQGLNETISRVSKITPKDTTSYTIVSNVQIKLLPPPDKEGRSNRAQALSSNSFLFFRKTNSTSDFFGIFAKFEDKEIIRTGKPGFGGWRIKDRKFEEIGTFGDPAVLRQ